MLDMGFIWLASLPLLAFAVGCSCEPAPVGDDEDSEAPPGDSETTADSEPGQDSEPPEPTEGPNLLLNGDFVQGEGAFPGVGLSWETNDAQPHDEDYLDYASPYSGAASQCIATGGSWDVGALRQVSAYGSVEAGAWYRLRAMVRAQGVENPAGWYLLGLWWFQDDSWLGEVKMEQPDQVVYDWSAVVIEAEAPAGAARAAAFLTAHTDGTACYDELVLARLDRERRQERFRAPAPPAPSGRPLR